ncbi:TIR domain-containing protein [Blastococcus sp. SYSU DS0539]
MPDSDASGGRIFVSHTGSDKRLATALEHAIESLCTGRIRVCHSSRKDSAGGVPTGVDWFVWIGEQVREADLTIAVLTPASLAKPWLLWETGAVYGATYAASDGRAERPLWPLLFKVAPGQLPGPLGAMNRQARRGDDPQEIRQLLEDIIDFLHDRGRLSSSDLRQATRRVDDTLDNYLSAIQSALRDLPIAPTEAAIQEWCARLDHLAAKSRFSEVDHLRDWLDIAFGRDENDRGRPLDSRIHRRLGELYLACGKYKQAAEQLRLTWDLAPRDVYVLRTLGEAALKDTDLEATGSYIEEIERLDRQAFQRNADCAALKGKLLRLKADLPGAREVYAAALKQNQDSYYLYDLLGQVELQRGDMPAATKAYREALNAVGRLDERSMWASATAATASLVLGQQAAMTQHLAAFARTRPSLDSVRALEGALAACNDHLPPSLQVSRDALRVPGREALQPG